MEVFWGKKRLFAYINPRSEYQKIYARRFDDALTEDEKKYILSVQLGKVVDYKPDLDHPQTWNEKIQWLKLHYHNPLLTKCAFKYAVREYVKEKIGGQYLIPLLGVWDKPEDIDFDALPDAFALKVNWGSGQNIIVKDKNKFDRRRALAKLRKWMRPAGNHYYYGLEWAYKDIKPLAIAEKYIEQFNGQVFDYKFFCFDGKPYCIYVAQYDEKHNCKISFLDLNWNLMPVSYGKHQKVDGELKQPEKWQEMIDIARKLSAGFPFVRVDLYFVGGIVYFGELTFYPTSGYNPFHPFEANVQIGRMIKLPEE